MATMVELIEMMINEILDQNDGEAKINRSNLAEQVSCVPSQITYVVKTRFSSGNGYVVESKRGGGGQIIIKRVRPLTKHEYLQQLVDSIDSGLTQQQARGYIENAIRVGALNVREGTALMAAVSDNSLAKVDTDIKPLVRADILKNAIAGFMLN
ncbi:MAG: CtsR family transcriptional regulator [Clostridia bacterium]|nr:CtsR family transcriptional regulator [Clostridia bacterium]